MLNQQLRRYVEDAVAILKWSALELMRIAERLSLAGGEADSRAVLKMRTVVHNGENRLVCYADESAAGTIARGQK